MNQKYDARDADMLTASFLPRHDVRPKIPPIKTQGIKSKLVPFILSQIRWDGRGRWVEPFLGSGVVLLNVRPRRALVSDVNVHIIRFYLAVQHGTISPHLVERFLDQEGRALLEKGEKHYYEIRDRFNAEHSPFDFLFLNRSCFNGVMRFNRRGGFNVPFCRKPERFRPALITKICNQVAWVNKQLAGCDWTFVASDWRETLAQAAPDDFVYLDPPYIGRHTDYLTQWSDSDATELATAVKALGCGFAYSMWKENKYRTNTHLSEHFSGFPIRTVEHFYHVGASEELRNPMQEALVVSHANVAQPEETQPGRSKVLSLAL